MFWLSKGGSEVGSEPEAPASWRADGGGEGGGGGGGGPASRQDAPASRLSGPYTAAPLSYGAETRLNTVRAHPPAAPPASSPVASLPRLNTDLI